MERKAVLTGATVVEMHPLRIVLATVVLVTVVSPCYNVPCTGRYGKSKIMEARTRLILSVRNLRPE